MTSDRVVIHNSRHVPTLRVAEVFGPTIQGEGKHMGRQTHFIRLSGCNLSCSWCDTPYTWDWSGVNGTKYDRETESKIYTVEELVNLMDQSEATSVVITGGEPLVQAKALVELANDLIYMGISVEIETNGTRPCPDNISRSVQWNISPKLTTSGNANGIKPKALRSYPASAIYKFVITDPTDIDEINRLGLAPSQVWLMPEGRTPTEINKRALMVANLALTHGYNYSHRLHVTLWGNKRGH